MLAQVLERTTNSFGFAGSENVQVMADHDLAAIELTDLFQQNLLRIRSAYAARVRSVVQDQ
jgi:hypothetical protein